MAGVSKDGPRRHRPPSSISYAIALPFTGEVKNCGHGPHRDFQKPSMVGRSELESGAFFYEAVASAPAGDTIQTIVGK
jgi:hypothetical protein